MRNPSGRHTVGRRTQPSAESGRPTCDRDPVGRRRTTTPEGVMQRFQLAFVVALALAPLAAAAQSAATSSTAALAPAVARRADVAPVIDGLADDAAWSSATPVSDFWQKEPEEG